MFLIGKNLVPKSAKQDKEAEQAARRGQQQQQHLLRRRRRSQWHKV